MVGGFLPLCAHTNIPYNTQLPLNKLSIYWKKLRKKAGFLENMFAFRLLYGKKNQKAVAFLIRNRTRVKIVILFPSFKQNQ